MLRKFKLLGVFLAAIILSISAQVYAAPNWNTNVIQVTGMGVAPPNAVSQAHSAMMARRAAVVDAYRQLAEVVNGVQVDSETTVEQMILTSDIVKTRISAVIKGAVIVSEGELSGGGYSVTMELPLFGGTGGLAETVIERPTTIEPFPTVAPDYRPPVDYTPPPIPDYQPPKRSSGHYSGLVVDCRGLGMLNPVMSPVIKNESGNKIYGHKNLDYDRIIREGMATYAQSMSQASRAGSNPLIVQAIRLDDLNATPVLSMGDAEMVLYENNSSHFLENIAVVFLY